MKIAITGATGQLGQLVLKALLKRTDASNLIALVRDKNKAHHITEQGIEIRLFDYDQPQTLVPALVGVDRLLLISANEIGRRTVQHQAVIDAAKLAGIQHLVYTSLLNADKSLLGLAQEHRETEARIQESGLAYTLLRNNWYSENYLAGLAHNIETGVLYGAAADGKISSASRQDYAEAAAEVLSTTGHENKTYELAGSNSFSLNDLAGFMSEASGKDVAYTNLSAEDYAHGLSQAGLASGLIDVIVDADIQAIQGAMFSESKDLENLLGRQTTPIKDLIQSSL